MISSVDSKNFEQNVLKSSIPTIVDFYSPLCGICNEMMPIFEELSKELMVKYQFVTSNIDQDTDLAINNNVTSIPTFIFFKNGKEVGRTQGHLDKQPFIDKIESFFA